MEVLNKLVRDRIVELIEKSGRTCTHAVLDDETYSRELRAKLLEEVQEYLDARNVEELADIMEVLFALAKVHGATEEQLLAVRAEKRAERGGFDGKVWLATVQETE